MKKAGDITTKNVRQVGQRLGGPNRAVNPGGADQLGQHMGNHADRGDTGKGNPATPLYGGRAVASKLGNELTNNVGKGGPGAGRDVHARGTQSTHGAVRFGEPAQPTGKDLGPRSILGRSPGKI